MLAATAMAWGGMFPVMKPLLAEIDPFTLTLARFGLSIPILVVLLIMKEGVGALKVEGRAIQLWWLGTLGFAGFGLLLVLGLKSTRPEHAAIVPALMPLIAIVVASVKGRTWPRLPALVSVFVGILGVAFVVTHGDPGALLHGGAGRGEALVFLGATCWVLYTFGAAKFPTWSGLRFTTLTLILGTLSILVVEIVVITAGKVSPPAMSVLLAASPSLAYLVLAASVMGFLFWNAGMRALGPARGVLFINLVPVTAFAVAIAFGHVPTRWEVVGVALVIGALVLNSFTVKAPAAASIRSISEQPKS
jgi:drug/metabolite transporter (DMT)-like permease